MSTSGFCRSTISRVMPSVGLAHSSRGVVRTSSRHISQNGAFVVHTFAPCTTYSSPSRTARVRIDVVSVPASGSVTPNATCSSPEATRVSTSLRELGRPVAAHRLHPEDRQVDRRAAVHRRAGRGDLLEHHRRLGDALAAAAVLLGDGDADPAALGERVVEVPRELVGLVLLRPVLVGEVGADPSDPLADRLVVARPAELHHVS